MKIEFLGNLYEIQTRPVSVFLNKLKKKIKDKNRKAVYVVTKKSVKFLYDSEVIKSFKYSSQQSITGDFRSELIIDKIIGLYADILGQIRRKETKRKVVHSTRVNLNPQELWSMLTNIEQYPKYIKYMQSSRLHGKFDVGNHWTDISTVMFYPMNVKHEIINIKEGREVAFLIKLPLGGKIVQKGVIEDRGKYISLKLEATIDLGHPLVDLLVGSILQKRTKKMFKGSLKNKKM